MPFLLFNTKLVDCCLESQWQRVVFSKCSSACCRCSELDGEVAGWRPPLCVCRAPEGGEGAGQACRHPCAHKNSSHPFMTLWLSEDWLASPGLGTVGQAGGWASGSSSLVGSAQPPLLSWAHQKLPLGSSLQSKLRRKTQSTRGHLGPRPVS